jgi:serine/threonine-protein kinase HipA
MMTSNKDYKEAFVWVWLPDEIKPVVAGKLQTDNENILFNYANSYLKRVNEVNGAISIYEPELPLKAGILSLLEGLRMPSCIRDAVPDAWGRRVIINKKLGLKGASTDTTELSELFYLLESGSDRIGALDFQQSPFEYVPRLAHHASLAELLQSVERVEKGIFLTDELDQALFRCSSIGGARPKALIEEREKKYIAKFSSSSDFYKIIKAEYIAMKLAALAGLNVAPVQLVTVSNKDVLLVERFDRKHTKDGWTRKSVVSALTLFGLDEMMARYASYETFAEIIRHRFTKPRETLKELFSRLVFNILCGNTDDHARNHAAFWNGKELALTPAFDICPQGRSGNEASQAMLISGNNNLSQFKTCLETAHNFLLSKENAREIFEYQKSIIEKNWHSICDEAQLSEVDKKLLWGRQFLNPYSIEG